MNEILTFLLYLMLKVTRYIPRLQISGLTSHFHGFNEVKQSVMDDLQRHKTQGLRVL